ncbi:MAG: MMPL family transporter, partial [Flavobacteriales bacterium]|nr:MMPL family transporter [Flavobacteriales bacterium]
FQDSVKYQDLLDLSNVSLKLSKDQNTKSVRSIFNERVLIKSSVIPFAVKIFDIDNYDKYKTSLSKIKKYGSKFATEDLNSFLFIIKSKDLDSEEQKRSYLNKLEKEFSQQNIKVYITGQIKSEIYMQDNVTKELLLFIILSSILCSLVLYFYLGNIKLVLINFISVCISLIFSFSLSNKLFGGIELVMILIPAIVFIITISDFMHLLNSDKLYKNKFRSFKTQLEKIGMPVFITSLTTAIGFLSFMFSSLIPLFRFGVITTITIFISLFVIVILYSLIIDFNINKNIKNNHFLDDLIVSIVHLKKSYSYVLLASFLVLSFLAFNNFKVDNFITDEINKNSDLYTDINFFDTKFGGIKPVTFIVKNENPSLSSLDSLEEIILNHNFVIDFSLNDFSKPDNNEYLIKARMKDIGSSQSAVIFDDILLKSKDLSLDLEIAGVGFLFDKISNKMTFEIILGLILAIIIIGLVFVLLNNFNWYYFPISLIPNILPLLTTIGLLSIFGFYFSLSNAFILAIVFGLIVDDSIHIINAYSMSRNRGLSIQESISHCQMYTYKAVIKTSVVIIFTLFPLLFSEFKSISQLSIITIIAAIIALIFDIIYLPKMLIKYIS